MPHLITADHFASELLVAWHEHPGTELVLVTHGRCAIDLGGPGRPYSPATLPAPPALSMTSVTAVTAATATSAPQEAPRAEPAAGANSLFILPARVPQRQRSFAFTRTTYTVFDRSDSAFDESARLIDIAAAPELARWLEDLSALFRRPGRAAATTADALLTAVLERINLLERDRQMAVELHPGLARALDFLRGRLAESLALADIASAAHCSPSHLTALFRARFGHGPMQHLQTLRMDLAKKLLPQPYARIQEVARACGYADPKYFARLFQRATGQTPRAWRGSSTPPVKS